MEHNKGISTASIEACGSGKDQERPGGAPRHLQALVPEPVCQSLLEQLWIALRRENVQACRPDNAILRKPALEVHGGDYPPMAHFHWGLTPALKEVCDADLLPSFSYFRLYVGGDICRVHSDRRASEFSLSLTLAYSDGVPWAFSVGTRAVTEHDPGRVTDGFGDEPFSTFLMKPGDAVFYPGLALRHGRLEPNPNKWSAHLFLQWVSRGGPNEEFALERSARA
jgi:hypothetical protein